MVYFTVGVWRCLKLVNQERPTLFYLCNACSGLGVIIVFDMKKIYFCLLACVVAFAGCSKDEDPGRSYTEQQEKALSVFNGTWADTQFSNLGDYPGAELQPDPDKIIFGTQNNKPVEIYENDFIEGERLAYSLPSANWFTIARGTKTYRVFIGSLTRPMNYAYTGLPPRSYTRNSRFR